MTTLGEWGKIDEKVLMSLWKNDLLHQVVKLKTIPYRFSRELVLE